MNKQDIKQPLELKNILVIPFVIVMSLSVLLTSYITLKYSEKTTSKLAIQISEKSAEIVKNKLDNYFDVADYSNQSLKSVIKYGFLDVNDSNKTLDYIADIVKNNNKISTLSFAYPNGAYIGISNTKTRNNTLLKKIASPQTSRMFYTYDMSTGKVIQQRENYDARVRPWFQEAKKFDKPVWSSVFEMFSSRKLGITFSEAVYKKGKFIGVLGTDVIFYDLNEQLNNIRLTDHAYLFIIDEDQHIIAQSVEPKKSETSLIKIADSNNAILKNSFADIDTNSNDFNKALYKSINITVDGKKEKYFLSLIPYSHGSGMNWHIGVLIPENDFLGNFIENRRNMLIFWLISFVLSIFVGLIITSIISRSIKSLKIKLDEIQYGIDHYEHDSYSIKEINDLSLTFANMSERLQKTSKESNTDALTQIANRRAFDEMLDTQWNNLESNEIQNVVLLMLDIDHFKQYNDLYGHAIGDTCLCDLAKILNQECERMGFVARIGGEEFAIILTNWTIDDAKQLADNIIKTLAQEKMPHKGSSVAEYVTVSIGIACTSKNGLKSKSSLMKHADIALYSAKQQGKNRYAVYKAKKHYFDFSSF